MKQLFSYKKIKDPAFSNAWEKSYLNTQYEKLCEKGLVRFEALITNKILHMEAINQLSPIYNCRPYPYAWYDYTMIAYGLLPHKI